MEFPNISDYIDQGLGVISFIVLVTIVIYTIKTIKPMLDKMNEQNTTLVEIIRNNTDAIKEVSRSNDNVASALQMLKTASEAQTKLFERHDLRSEHIETEVTKIGERTLACANKK